MPAQGAPLRARIGFGEVRHKRLAPVEHAFAYPTCFLMLPLRSLRRQPDAVLARNRRAPFGFRDADHGDGRADSLAWIEDMLASEGIADADGEVWLHCIPRMFGFAFKPVSFWYCHRADDSLAAIVVEVNNTFGQRHCYLLRSDTLAFGRELRVAKAFYVSPFCAVAGDYRFRFLRTDLHPAAPGTRMRLGQILARIDHHDDDGLLLQTSVSGALEPLTRRSVALAFLRIPLLTLAIVLRIHWQAVRLWAKRVPLVARPAPPSSSPTR